MIPTPKGVSKARALNVFDKYTGKQIGSVPSMSVKEADSCVKRASAAKERIGVLSAKERKAVLDSAAERILKEKSRFVPLLISETGMTRGQAGMEVERAAAILKLYSSELTHLGRGSTALDADMRGEKRHGYSFRVPAGVVLAISAFNNPLVVQAHKLGPALAAGDAVVFKPASLAPLSAVRVCEILVEAGVPSDALQIVTGAGEVLGPALAADPAIRVVSFTGSYETGTLVAKAAGVKRLLMELGGNCPNIICSDCNLDETVDSVIDAAYSFQGQNCLHAQRILVQNEVFHRFAKRFIDRVSKLRMGDPNSSSTDVGPMISEDAAVRVESWVKEAVAMGAEVLVGGRRSGPFFEPTLLANVPRRAKVVCDEVYGPVSVISKFPTVSEAIREANDTAYGLQAAIFTASVHNALDAILHLSFGTVVVNSSTDYRADVMPFGGLRNSGLGREGIGYAIEAMTEVKNVIYQVGRESVGDP